ncbi:hypothetical protein [Niabella hibiscisoli]|uniref:hypothetical protein n=1 Tax=Niabella hibiscisoli TaxID=1825928 RepID=UPI001F0ECC68|nr:hypothetical protein [Niabella hibiscisoli]MCH5721029.1 hypothetical protein [Niabella hibiscisoli]
MPYRTPFTLSSDEVCIDYETDITAGNLEVNDAYDLYLIAKGKPVRRYLLVCFMNLQFFFRIKMESGQIWRKGISLRNGNRT